jgi:hypothetical protein
MAQVPSARDPKQAMKQLREGARNERKSHRSAELSG